jgi:uncharacterized membrane-anchored protein YjiN (DUF445 family)
MATNEELFVSIPPETYRYGKSAALMSQAGLLRTMKHLQNMKVLARERNDLKKRLLKLLSSTSKKLDSLKNKLPEPEIPKELRKKKTKKSAPLVKTEVFEEEDRIEKELKDIQAKLRQLNS